jgi:hypothetical protein
MRMSKVKVKFNQDFIQILKIYARIGKRSNETNKSFVLIKDTSMKVSDSYRTVASVFKYETLGLPQPIALYDANKLLKIISKFGYEKEYTLDFKADSHIKLSVGRSKFTLSTVEYEEAEEPDVDNDCGIISDEKFDKIITLCEDNSIAKFTLTNDDIVRIKVAQDIINVKNKFTFKNSEDELVATLLEQANQSDADSSKVSINNDITKNEIEENSYTYEVPLNIFKSNEDYDVIISDDKMNNLIVLKGKEIPIEYFVSKDVSNELLTDDDNEEIDEYEFFEEL